MNVSLIPQNPAGWAQHRYEVLFRVGPAERERIQLTALKHPFERLKEKVPALQVLARKQGVERIETVSDAPPL